MSRPTPSATGLLAGRRLLVTGVVTTDSIAFATAAAAIEAGAELVLSGHGEPITDHVGLIDSRFAAIDRRKEKIFKLIEERPRSGYELAQAIWGNVAVTQAFLTLSEVIGNTDLLVNEGRVREVDDGSVVRYEVSG